MKKKYTQIISGAILFVCGVCRKKSGKSVIWIGFETGNGKRIKQNK